MQGVREFFSSRETVSASVIYERYIYVGEVNGFGVELAS